MRLLILAILLVVPLTAAINEEVLLDSIASVETGNREIWGAHGELGQWQLTPSVRARVGGGHDRAAATRWLRIVEHDMTVYHIDVNPFNTAIAWNGGIGSIRRGRVAMSTYDYALRVANTYSARLPRPLIKPTIALTPPMFVIPSHP